METAPLAALLLDNAPRLIVGGVNAFYFYFALVPAALSLPIGFIRAGLTMRSFLPRAPTPSLAS